MLGVLGGLAVVVSLAFLAFGLADAAPVVKMNPAYPKAVKTVWWTLVVLGVGTQVAPWILEVAG